MKESQKPKVSLDRPNIGIDDTDAEGCMYVHVPFIGRAYGLIDSHIIEEICSSMLPRESLDRFVGRDESGDIR